ncbi:hypothetical protein ALC57_11183 [Trachymyrmex cornetzi]|uniref:Uncharacterized protein n=1 Tax=Trachymyrmex cornetzi TaxID=471704 RepID=A0A151J2W8_9HYME|nr:hypothetical protein ALC57_11183 [Trachymyrmex cornetzi]
MSTVTAAYPRDIKASLRDLVQLYDKCIKLGVTNLPLGGKRGPMCGNERSGVLSRPGLPRLNRNMRHITQTFSTK